MEQISFKDIYMEGILSKIKKNVAEQINLNENSFENSCNIPKESSVERADRVMREILADLLLENTNSEGEISYKYNFLVFTKGGDEEAKQELMCSLISYYTALYFDNVLLLQKLIREGYYLESNPDNMSLCLLDREISTAFDSARYCEILKKNRIYFKPFYESIKDETVIDRKRYIKKFANILQNREVPYGDSIYFHFLKRDMFNKIKLDLFEEETYMKATNDQLKYIIAGNTLDAFDENYYKKLNNVIKETNFSVNCNSNERLKTVINLFTIEELAVLNMDNSTVLWFDESYIRGADMERVKKIYMTKPEISQWNGFLFPNILDLYDDETICNFTVEIINNLKHANDRRLLTGELTAEREAKIRKIVEGKKKTNNLLVKIFKN